jgi:hypothetical protein
MLKHRLTTRSKLSTVLKLAKSKAPLALLAVVALTGLSCGKRKPPLPPKERVLQHVEITGFQRGNQVILSWKMPARNAPQGSVLNISRADIYRLAEPLSSPQTLSEEEFASRSTLVATLNIRDSDFGAKELTYADTLQFAGQAARLRYALRFVNASGQKAGFSNFVSTRTGRKDRGSSDFPLRCPDAGCDQARLGRSDSERRRFDAGEPAWLQRLPFGIRQGTRQAAQYDALSPIRTSTTRSSSSTSPSSISSERFQSAREANLWRVASRTSFSSCPRILSRPVHRRR